MRTIRCPACGKDQDRMGFFCGQCGERFAVVSAKHRDRVEHARTYDVQVDYDVQRDVVTFFFPKRRAMLWIDRRTIESLQPQTAMELLPTVRRSD